MPEQPRHLANKYEDIANLQGAWHCGDLPHSLLKGIYTVASDSTGSKQEHRWPTVTTGTQIGRLIEFYSTEGPSPMTMLISGRILTRLPLTQFKELNHRIRRSRRRQ